MAEIVPILLNIEPWDSEKGTNLYFSYTGSKQAVGNKVVVTDVDTSEIVYSFEYVSFERTHPLPPREFVNGKTYKAKLQVKLSDGTYSPFSNEVVFKTFKTPVLDIISIDGQGYVYNQDITFEATYSQANGENVKSYKFSLYDENEDLIKDYPLRDANASTHLTEVISGLEKSVCYFVECSIETVNGVTWSHRERFIPMYIVPSVNGLIQTVNDEDNGIVRITTNLKQITGTQVKGTPKVDDDGYDSNNYEYIDDEWVVIPSDRPVIFQGLSMNKASDFVLKLWCKNLPDGKMFAEVSHPNHEDVTLEFWKYSDKIIAVKNMNDITARYRSNTFPMPKEKEFMVYVKVIEHRIDIQIQGL